MIKQMLLFLVGLYSVSVSAKSLPIDSLLAVLDKHIAMQPQYTENKNQYITTIKAQISSTQDLYNTYKELSFAYQAFIVDSALFYIDKCLKVATEENNHSKILESSLQKGNLLASAGLLYEALMILSHLQPYQLSKPQRENYYSAYENTYRYLSEYAFTTEYALMYKQKMTQYRDSVLQVVESGTYRHITSLASQMIDLEDYSSAEKLLLSYLLTIEPGTRSYAIMTSLIAILYKKTGDKEQQKYYLILSAVTDEMASVRENTSIRLLAHLLFEEGDIESADRYIKESIADANFFGSRLRNIQVSQILPIIDTSSQIRKENQRLQLLFMLTLVCLLVITLLVALGYILRQMKKISKARRKIQAAHNLLQESNNKLILAHEHQRNTNNILTETNRIKEEYIARFMLMCSDYIDKLEGYRRILHRMATHNKREELYKTLQSTEFIEEEWENFYRNFDNAFLNLFPNFVIHLNNLLPESEQILLKKHEKLTPELRIFALVRLGITDSSKISSFLRYSITTIYTYRSKLKNKSLVREQFEEKVMAIPPI